MTARNDSARLAQLNGITRGLQLRWGDASVPVRRIWKGGLALDIGTRPLPGLVQLYAGDRHLATGLICSDAIEHGEHRFHFKRMTFCMDRAPADYAIQDDTAIAGLLPAPDRIRAGL